MSRIRTVKPDFFRHEELFEAEKKYQLPLRLAFSGLWTCCDREGRFRWKPRQLKLDVLPYDEVDFEKILEALVDSNFIIKYSVNGEHYGYVPSWAKHQIINPREKASVLPAPIDASSTCEPRDSETHVHARGEGEKEVEEEGKGNELTQPAVVVENSPTSSPPENPPEKPSEQKPPPCAHEKIIAMYHTQLPNHPHVVKWTLTRQKHLQARWREHPELEFWEKFFTFVGRSTFLTGKAHSRDRPPFIASLDWLVKAENFAKVLEKKYHEQ